MHRSELPAVLGDGHRHGTGARGGDGGDGAVVGGLLDKHAVAGLCVGRQDEPDRVQRARGDHDLVGLRGKPSRAVPFGDGFA